MYLLSVEKYHFLFINPTTSGKREEMERKREKDERGRKRKKVQKEKRECVCVREKRRRHCTSSQIIKLNDNY